MKILLAVDGSSCSDTAVDSVARRPWPAGSEFLVISVAEPPPLAAMPDTWAPTMDLYNRMQAEELSRATAAVGKAETLLRGGVGSGMKIKATVLEGFPKEAIVQEAERWAADLIVVGSHGYHGLKRMWLGSVSLAVASHATCSVEIVRSGHESKRD
jgi:nucleotide-binding universal stress UspA family protein